MGAPPAASATLEYEYSVTLKRSVPEGSIGTLALVPRSVHLADRKYDRGGS